MFASSFFTALAYITADVGFRFFHLSVPNLVFWSFFGALLFSAPFFLGKKIRRKNIALCLQNHGKLLVFTSILISAAAILWFWVLSGSNSGIVSLLDKSEILWAMLLGIFFLGEKINKKELLILILPVLGLLLISQLEGEISSFSALATLFIALIYALQSFFVKKYMPEVDGFSFAFLRACVLFLCTGVFFLLQGSISLIPFSAFLFIAFGQMSGILIGRVFFFNAHKYLDISRLNLFQILIPLFVLLGSTFLFPDVSFSLQKGIGAVLILGGLLLFLREHFQKNERDLP